jgi:very-short-patch-repair endonuclease
MGKDNRRRSIEEIRPVFEQASYQLLSTEYVNNVSPLQTLCPNGHKWETTWGCFSHGTRCRQGYCDKRRMSFEKVKEIFEKRGYTLLSTEYISTHIPLKTLCPNNHVYWVSFANFTSRHGYGQSKGKERKGCRQCSYEKSRLDEEQVRQALQVEGYKMLSKYKKCCVKFKIECPKGDVYETTWDIFKSGCRCPVCANEKWVSESKLGEILQQIFPTLHVEPQDNLGFLKPQRVDFSVRELHLAFEYDGEGHFMPIMFGKMTKEAAKKNLQDIKKRDKRKNRLCKKNGIHLIRFKYTDSLTKKVVEQRIQAVLVQFNISHTFCASPESVDSEKI